MGGGCACGRVNKTEVEESISSLINSLVISKISNKEYVTSIRSAYSRNLPSELKKKIKEYLRPTDINYRSSSEEIQNFVDKLFTEF